MVSQKIFILDGIAKIFINLEDKNITSYKIESLHDSKIEIGNISDYEEDESDHLISDMLSVFCEEFVPSPKQDSDEYLNAWQNAYDTEIIPFMNEITMQLFGCEASDI